MKIQKMVKNQQNYGGFDVSYKYRVFKHKPGESKRTFHTERIVQLNLDLRDSSVTNDLSLKPSFLLNRVFFLLTNHFWSQKVVS